MRYITYYRFDPSRQETSEFLFDASHYTEAGVPCTPMCGMPILESHQLVDKWNRAASGKLTYWLGATR